jgi:hypothetical protein
MTAVLLALCLQSAREVIASDRPVEVSVPVSTDTEHRATVVSFPEDSLEALVAGWNENDLSIERRRENLFIKLLRKARGDVHVLGGSGALYRLTVVPADGPYDGHVRILAPKEAKRGVPESVDLLRAMRLGRLPIEGSVLRSDLEISASPEWSLRVLYVYETTAYRGYVARIGNGSAVALRLDPSRFVSRNLVLCGARELLLAPGENTLLYLVFWKAP